MADQRQSLGNFKSDGAVGGLIAVNNDAPLLLRNDAGRQIYGMAKVLGKPHGRPQPTNL